MSSGLMSCVRENARPLESVLNVTAGPSSLSEVNNSDSLGATTSTPLIATTSILSCSSSGGIENTKKESNATSIAEQQKRRRFHPLRNLRRIFRRRTIPSATDTSAVAVLAANVTTDSSSVLAPSTSSFNEKNLRRATLTVISSTTSASSPSSPLTQSLPKSKSYSTHRDELLSVFLGKKKKSKASKSSSTTPTHETNHQDVECNPEQLKDNSSEMYSSITEISTSTSFHQQFQQKHAQHLNTQHQSIGITVFPAAMNRSFFTECPKLRSTIDSSQELDSSGNESSVHNSSGAGHMSASNKSKMSDSQRSLSEGRLMDSDYTRDALSQSHDSVFSESATASSLSIVLKAELADVLRKRRNRPDASDEDLGLPHSPESPQRRTVNINIRGSSGCAVQKHTNTTANVSSSSLRSMNSTKREEGQNSSIEHRINTLNSTSSSLSVSSDILRLHQEQSDEVDRVGNERQWLSHSAAKHKMAVRPTKKKIPTRQHRRTVEISMPEINEDNTKLVEPTFSSKIILETGDKIKCRSLTSDVKHSKLVHQNNGSKSMTTCIIASSKQNIEGNTTGKKETTTKTIVTCMVPEKSSIVSSSDMSHIFDLSAFTTKTSAFFDHQNASIDEQHSKNPNNTLTTASVEEINECGFLRRLIHRNSKRTLVKANVGDDGLDLNQSEPKKLQISTSHMEMSNRDPLLLSNKSRSATSFEQNIEETRKTIKREIINEGKNGLSAMVNNYGLTVGMTGLRDSRTSASKPKSGAAARQRYIPQELSPLSTTPQKYSDLNNDLNNEEVISVTNLLSKSSRDKDTFQSTSIVRDITAAQQVSTSVMQVEPHFEKKPKIIDLSAFQQKLSRSNDSFGRNSISFNSLETSTDESSPLYYVEKQRKAVEKSRSFRNYEDELDSMIGVSSSNNMPSLPDLTLSFRLPAIYYNDYLLKNNKVTVLRSPTLTPPLIPTEKSVSLSFEINDNKLLKPMLGERSQLTEQLPVNENVLLSSSNKKTTPKKLINATTVVASTSASNSTNIIEIEQNIDMIVKSPFVSVLRKSANIVDEICDTEQSLTTNPVFELPVKHKYTNLNEDKEAKKVSKELLGRSKGLKLTQTAEEQQQLISVPLREKAYRSTLNGASVEVDRKSAPAITLLNSTFSKAHSFKTSRRYSSVVEITNTTDGNVNGTNVPEFMKIQLNRVESCVNKGNNIVLAKNVTMEALETNVNVPTERRRSSDDLNTRCYSNESIEIIEYDTQEATYVTVTPQAHYLERQNNMFVDAINRPIHAVSANSVRSSICGNNILGASMLKNPVKPAATISAVIKPSIKKTVISPKSLLTNEFTKVAMEEAGPMVILRTAETNLSPKRNKISLEERRRIFLNEDKVKTEKKVGELHIERKKFINDEVYRKSTVVANIEERQDIGNTNNKINNNTTVAAITAVTNTNTPIIGITAQESVALVANSVTLRKKSFVCAPQSFSSNDTNNNNDPTPELIKVFARRSLKAKDEEFLMNNNASTGDAYTVKKSFNNNQTSQPLQHQSIDSDKENQSASEEKLDKLPKYETNVETIKIAHSSNRNSLSDFRNGITNNDNTTNNNNTNNSTHTNASASTINVISINAINKSHLPPIKVSYTPNTSQSNNLSTNTKNMNQNQFNVHNNKAVTLPNDPILLQTKREESDNANTTKATTSATLALPIKFIERSATMGEFKGIHQRRAEWEQRAKEALK